MGCAQLRRLSRRPAVPHAEAARERRSTAHRAGAALRRGAEAPAAGSLDPGGLQEGLDDFRGHGVEFHPEPDRRLRVRYPADEADDGAAEGHPDRDARSHSDRRSRFDVTAGRGEVAEPRRGRTGHAVDPAFD